MENIRGSIGAYLLVLLGLVAIVGVLSFRLASNQKPTYPEKNIPEEVQTELGISNGGPTKKSLSLGLFYPFSDGQTINNAQPTIYGRIPQNERAFLTTQFGIEPSPVSGNEEHFLRFIPGRVKDLTISVDGKAVESVFGFAQYPTVWCESYQVNPDGSSRPDNLIFATEDECFTAKNVEVPPLIFVFKPSSPLSTGSHTLNIANDTITYPPFTFVVDPEYALPPQQVPKMGSNFSQPNPFQTTDNCGSGYYYDAEHLRVPMVRLESDNLLYQLNFPQTKEEKATNQRRVYLSFEGQLFDFFFPSGQTFYAPQGRSDSWLNGKYGLYLPTSLLYYSDGTKARPPQFGTYSDNPDGGELIGDNYSGYDTSYYEVQPVDMSGREYLKNSLPWIITGSSSCDG